MWINKKDWINLFDENFKLKKKIEKLEHIENANTQAGTGTNCDIGGNYILINYIYYNNLIQQIDFNEEEIKRLKEEVMIYKGGYMDELQKRLELTNKVKELEERQTEQK
jgi:two-component SAPR family response regulator|nr:MAG TPA: hypothetical protein [Caudoviricetes sp.]